MDPFTDQWREIAHTFYNSAEFLSLGKFYKVLYNVFPSFTYTFIQQCLF